MATVSAMYNGPAPVLVIDGYEYPKGALLQLDTTQYERVLLEPALRRDGHSFSNMTTGGGTAKAHGNK